MIPDFKQTTSFLLRELFVLQKLSWFYFSAPFRLLTLYFCFELQFYKNYLKEVIFHATKQFFCSHTLFFSFFDWMSPKQIIIYENFYDCRLNVYIIVICFSDILIDIKSFFFYSFNLIVSLKSVTMSILKGEGLIIRKSLMSFLDWNLCGDVIEVV